MSSTACCYQTSHCEGPRAQGHSLKRDCRFPGSGAMHLESHCFWEKKNAELGERTAWHTPDGGVQERSTSTLAVKWGPAPTKTRGASPLLWPQGAPDDFPFVKSKLGSTDVTDVILYWILGFCAKEDGERREGGVSEATLDFGSCSAANNELSPSHSQDKS